MTFRLYRDAVFSLTITLVAGNVAYSTKGAIMIPFSRLRHGSSRLRIILAALLLVSGVLLAALNPQPPPLRAYAATTVVIYDDALGSGWANWSWAATINLSSTTPLRAGTHSIAVTYTSTGWGALYLHVDPAFDT